MRGGISLDFRFMWVAILLTALLAAGGVYAATPVTTCQEISSPGVYELQDDLTNSSICIRITSSDVTFDGQGYTIKNGTGSNYGVYVYDSSTTITNVTVKNLIAMGWSNGIYYQNADNGTLANNTASNNGWSGIYLSPYSSSNSLSGNTATSNGIDGIALWNSNSNTLSGNTANNNNDDGIHLYSSNSSTIYNNTANNNNDAGIYLWSSRSNSIYNNYFNNTQNVEFNNAGTNDWNTTKAPGTNIINGSYLGGNFWATPGGTGFSQTCSDSDSDGICDSSYSLSSGNVDYLPLAKGEKGTLWYFAEGYTGSGFNEQLDILNPGTSTASVNITYMTI